MLSKLSIVILVFIFPVTLFTFLLVALTMIINTSANPVNPSPANDVFAGDIAIALGIFFGLLSIALAVWFGFSEKIRDFLHETKKGTIDEKIAMIYTHAANISLWNNSEETVKNFNTERIKSDIRSIGRIKKSIIDEQKETLITAKNELLREMKNRGLSKESEDISLVFNTFLW